MSYLSADRQVCLVWLLICRNGEGVHTTITSGCQTLGHPSGQCAWFIIHHWPFIAQIRPKKCEKFYTKIFEFQLL